MVKIALVANSKISNEQLIAPLILRHDVIIAVDGGLNQCDRMEIEPNLIIGDLDSVDQKLMRKYSSIPTKTYPKEKDYSDLELALVENLRETTSVITLFGVLENRLDHALGNLYLLSRFPGRAIIESDHETVHCVSGFKAFQSKPGQEVSCIPFPSPCSGVTTSGLKWEVEDRTLDKTFYSLSNVALGESFNINVEEGTLLCCLLRN
ncbi:MAG: thiamine diphosphokinase [Chlamydiota bacterium]